MAKSRGGGSGFGRVFLGFVIGIVAAAIAGYTYNQYHARGTKTAYSPFFPEKRPGGPSLKPHGAAEKLIPPFGISEDVFEAGAHVYRAQCARCHGVPGRDAILPKGRVPLAGQLWKKRGARTNDRDPGAVYQTIAGGATGMPAYRHVLTDTQMWQVSLLLTHAGQELPQPVIRILTGH